MESVEIEVYSLLRINDNPKQPFDVKNMSKLPLFEMEYITNKIDFWIKNPELN